MSSCSYKNDKSLSHVSHAPSGQPRVCAISKIRKPKHPVENHYLDNYSMKFGVTLKDGNLLLEAPEEHIVSVRRPCRPCVRMKAGTGKQYFQTGTYPSIETQ